MRAATCLCRMLLALGVLLLPGGAANPADAAEVVILLADRLERADVWEHRGPHLERLRREAAVGLMCSRFLLSSLPESAYAMLGAASYVQYEGSERWRGGGSRADAAAFQVATGRVLPPGALYCRETPRLRLYSNEDARPGALGDALRAAGKRTACIGNGDLPDLPRRHVLSVLMGSDGVVDGGDVGAEMLLPDAGAPGGLRADVPAMVAAFEQVAARADVVALDYGDTARLQLLRDELSPEAYARARQAALDGLDALVGALRARIDPERCLFLLLSPTPPVAPSATEQVLTPVFVAGPGYGPGMLRSATTRQPGVIASADVAATVTHAVGAPPVAEGVGNPLTVAPMADRAERLRDREEATRRVSLWRFTVFRVWAVMLAVVLAAGTLLLVLRYRGVALGRARQGVRALQLAALSLPVATFAAACFAPRTLGEYFLVLGVLVAATAGGASLLARARRGMPAPFWIAVLTVAAFLGDAAAGAPRLSRMMVSYSLTEGARYYGVGNELMGIAIGLALVGVMAVLPSLGRRAPWVMIALGAVLVLGLGHHAVGVNFGGGLTAAVTFSACAVLFARLRGARAVALPLLAAGAAGVVLVALDLLHGPAAMSHIGRAAGSVNTAGMDWLETLAARKIHLNWILVGRTRLTLLFFLALPVLLGIGLRSPAWLRLPHSGIRPLLFAGAVGGAAAFLFNDSGIIAGGLLLAFVALGAGYLALGEDAGARGLEEKTGAYSGG